MPAAGFGGAVGWRSGRRRRAGAPGRQRSAGGNRAGHAAERRATRTADSRRPVRAGSATGSCECPWSRRPHPPRRVEPEGQPPAARATRPRSPGRRLAAADRSAPHGRRRHRRRVLPAEHRRPRRCGRPSQAPVGASPTAFARAVPARPRRTIAHILIAENLSTGPVGRQLLFRPKYLTFGRRGRNAVWQAISPCRCEGSAGPGASQPCAGSQVVPGPTPRWVQA